MPHRGSRLACGNKGIFTGRLDQAKHTTCGIHQHRQLPQLHRNRRHQYPTP